MVVFNLVSMEISFVLRSGGNGSRTPHVWAGTCSSNLSSTTEMIYVLH